MAARNSRWYAAPLLLIASLMAGCAADTDPTPGGDATMQRADTTHVEGDAAAIHGVLQRQADAWNRGDIREYMSGYAQSDTLRFASGGNVMRGWEPTLQRYLRAYPDEGAMGRLSFSDLEIWPMGDVHAAVFGRWELTRSEGYENIGGLFTLIFEKGPAGWRIVHDHTSARESVESE